MDERIEGLLAALTLDEKCALVAGVDLWHTPGVERLGIGALKVSDGPSGVRGERFGGTASTSFPCATALGATWDPDLVGRVAAAIGDEARGKGVHVLLGPTVNLHRHPLAGRHFECYSEDPYLTARLAVAFVEGVQSRGVGACVKHLVANDSEFERMTISSEVPERALRELYLAPFEAAVREAGAWSVMSAYNRLGGTYCSEHRGLLTDVLKGEWGFDGAVVSDWFGTHSTVDAANGGLDLEMPGPPIHFGEHLAAAVRGGQVDETTVDDKIRRLLRLSLRTGALDAAPVEEACDEDPARTALAREAAIAGTLLLRNEGLLPFDPASLRSLAVIGPNADFVAVQGGGSARVTPHHVVTPLDALTARFAGTEVAFERGVDAPDALPAMSDRWLDGPLAVEYRDGDAFDGDPVLVEHTGSAELIWLGKWSDRVDTARYTARARATLVPDTTGSWRLSLTSVGRCRLLVDGEVVVDNWTKRERGTSFFGFGSTEVVAEVPLTADARHTVVAEYESGGLPIGGLTIGLHPPVPTGARDRAAALAARCDAAVVVVGTNGEWESEGHDRPHWRLPGDQDALVEAVTAANARTVVVVNAAAPVALDRAERAGALVQLWFPGQDGGAALAAVLAGDADPGGRLPTTLPARIEDTPAFTAYPGEAGQVHYGEGVFAGYRWYDGRGIAPRFPFGFGLSYTTFEYTGLAVDGGRVTVTVRNTGARAGCEVVQCYVHPLGRAPGDPVQALRAFAKVHLEPGEAREVVLALDDRAFASWDPARHAWVERPGDYEIRVGSSSRDARLTAQVPRPTTPVRP